MELLVVITIIGILIALLLPAVQAAREAARMTQCKNNLKQLALGCLQHENIYKRFPTGGWGVMWVGEPERGTDKNQPGGWIYNILPYIEQQALRDMGAGLPANARNAAIIQRCKTPLSMLNCPSRRRAIMYPDLHPTYNAWYHTATSTTLAIDGGGRSDYAINYGNTVRYYHGGPADIAQGDNEAWWQQMEDIFHWATCTGICYARSEISMAQIRDGVSNTCMIGEKYLNPDHYDNGVDRADNENLFVGFDNDLHRSTHPGYPILQDCPGYGGASGDDRFGSAHAVGLHMAFCDGSVQMISYSIDPLVFSYLGDRNDGLAIDGKKF